MKTPSRRLAVLLRQTEPWLPAVLLGTSAFWTGTFQAPMWPEAVLAGYLLLAASVTVVPAESDDPLGLGPKWRWLPFALFVCVGLGVLFSPARLAGWVAMMTLPMWLLLPSTVARCWNGARRRRQGLLAVASVLAAAATWGLWSFFHGHSEGVALPLGHHNLVALWCLALMPLVTPLLVARRFGDRLVSATALLLAAAAVTLTKSLAGGIGLLLWLLWTAYWSRGLRSTRWIRGTWIAWVHRLLPMVTGLSAVLLHRERLLAILSGEDLSWAARLAYWQGTWQGILERPWGWGAGSTAWTLAEHLPIRPGVLLPGQAVADAHSLPLALLYELGLPGGILLAAVLGRLVWTWTRSSERLPHRGPAMATLSIAMVMSLAGAPLSVTALPTAWLIGMGSGWNAPAPRPALRWGYVAAVLGPLLIVVMMQWGAISYSQAQGADTANSQRQLLRQAVALGQSFPLYDAHLGRLEVEGPPEAFAHERGMRRLRKAAEKAYGVPSLWLWSGTVGAAARESETQLPLIQACRLDPLGAMAPYLLATTWPDDPRAATWAARALMAEPRLLAADPWVEEPDQLTVAISLLERDETINAGWRDRLVESHAWLLQGSEQPRDWRRLVLSMDAEPATSVSLHTFRRRPWPVPLVSVKVDAAVLGQLDLVALSGVRTETPSKLWSQGCDVDRR